MTRVLGAGQTDDQGVGAGQSDDQGGLSCLGEVELRSPGAVRAGDSLQLDCLYDLEGAPLYSVKFYQGDEEFYRYVPKESPPTRVFPRPKLQVDLGGSNSTRVTLRAVDKELTGVYKCEVSADAPLFHTAIRTAHLVVTVEPESGPEINLEKTKYTPGERLRANCSSRPAFPAANLTFYINGEKVERGDRSRLWWYLKSEERGLESSRLELETVFPGGNLQLSCRAVQFALYSRTAHVYLVEDAPLLAHVLGPKSSETEEIVTITLDTDVPGKSKWTDRPEKGVGRSGHPNGFHPPNMRATHTDFGRIWEVIKEGTKPYFRRTHPTNSPRPKSGSNLTTASWKLLATATVLALSLVKKGKR